MGLELVTQAVRTEAGPQEKEKGGNVEIMIIPDAQVYEVYADGHPQATLELM